jgi:hypothetical protein
VNNWLSIWTKPKETIARVVAENPNKGLWVLAWIYGFCSLMNLFQSAVIGNSLGIGAILVVAIVLAPLWGYASFCVWSAVVHWVGKWFKGQGTFKTVRAAYAWSCVPIAVNVPLWLLMVALFGHQLFLNFPDAHLMPQSSIMIMFVILIIKVILAVWSLVIYLNALAEVQGFSVLKAILNVVVAGVILGVILFVIWSLLGHAMMAAFFVDGTFLQTLRSL